MSRRLALIAAAVAAFVLSPAVHAAGGALPDDDPGPMLPFPSPGGEEGSPTPVGGAPPIGPARSAGPWRIAAAPRPAGGLTRALSDGSVFRSEEPGVAATGMARARSAGARVIRVPLFWNTVEHFHDAASEPENPDSVGYDFARFDETLRLAASRGLTPLVTVAGAPLLHEGPHRWRYAVHGSWAPDPAAFAAFATAAARRYSGRHPDPMRPGAMLPRVRLWQAWNEPNLVRDLSPQWVVRGGRWVAWAPAHYRRMLNAFHAAVKAVDPGATVVTAGTAPDGDPRDGAGRMMPVRFWQSFFCLGAAPRLALRACPDPARFDVLAYHPLSIANPARPAPGLGVGIRDLAKLRRLLDAARRTGRAQQPGPARIWVTEMNWNSTPDRGAGGTPAQLMRWIPQALHMLWRQGVGLVTWQLLRDPPDKPLHPAGLWSFDPAAPLDIARDRPKRQLAAFRFPFTVQRLSRRRVDLWGLLPAAGPRTALLQRLEGGRWRRAARLRVTPAGMVHARIVLRGPATLRLRAGRPATASPPAHVRS
jgi:hypothetical protein